MKKLILLSMIFFCSFSYGQKFILTPQGLRDSNDTTKTSIVINANDKTAKQLYNNAVKFINKNYQNPNNAIKGKIENEFINFSTYVPNYITVMSIEDKKNKIKPFECSFSLKYTISLNFKDGKFKYEIINLVFLLDRNEYYVQDLYTDWKFKGNETLYKNVADYFNADIAKTTNVLTEDNKDGNW